MLGRLPSKTRCGAMRIAPHRVFEGNRPSTTILLDELTPRTLGQLIAAYEHKIFVQGVLWDVYSYDQWGVELGKVLAKRILPNLRCETADPQFDASTSALIRRYQLGSSVAKDCGDTDTSSIAT